MEDPDRRLKHQLRDLFLFGGLFLRRHRRFQRLALALARPDPPSTAGPL